jgi:hypothetical protein
MSTLLTPRRMAFISSPLKAIATCHTRWSKAQILAEARRIARQAGAYVWKELRYLPFSPVLAYSDIFIIYELGSDLVKSAEARAVVMEMCQEDLKRADVFIWTDCEYSLASEGMRAEQALANSLNMRTEIVEVF